MKNDRADVAVIAAALCVTARAAQQRAAGENWPFIEQPVRGGRKRLYEVSCLPADVQTALADKAMSAVLAESSSYVAAGALFSSTRGLVAAGHSTPVLQPGSTPGPRSLPAVGDLAGWQLDVAAARAALLDECAKIADAAAITVARAETLLVDRAKAGILPQPILDLVRIANARRGKNGRTLSIARIANWRKRATGAATPAERLARLAPGGRGKRWTLAGDVASALALFRKPNKPALRWCVKEICGTNSGPAFNSLYARCRRELKKLPAPLFHVGRNTGSALKALQPFHRREFLSMQPNDVWVGDGHGAKLKIAHPDTGRPFVPEVTVVFDVATRFAVGWSVALSENCIAVSDALRHGVARHGIPLVYYSDNGAGQANKMFDAPVTGILDGLGVHHETGIAGNAQGRGVMERFWRTVLIPLARRFATFQGKGADRDTLRRVTIEIDRQIRAAERGELARLPERLPTFVEFVAALEQEIDGYNLHHHHRSLPKLDGRHHATPAEYRAARLAGAEVQILPAQEVAALFMPSVLRKPVRGEVKLWNGVYFHRDLMLVDREEVRVCYDIHDASYVIVRKLSGEVIARAELGGNAGPYFPKPLIERLRDERAARRRGRLEEKLTEVALERSATTTFAAPTVPNEELARLEAEYSEPVAVNVRDLKGDDQWHAHWKRLDERRRAGEQLTEQEEQQWKNWQTSDYFRIAREEEAAFDRRMNAG